MDGGLRRQRAGRAEQEGPEGSPGSGGAPPASPLAGPGGRRVLSLPSGLCVHRERVGRSGGGPAGPLQRGVQDYVGRNHGGNWGSDASLLGVECWCQPGSQEALVLSAGVSWGAGSLWPGVFSGQWQGGRSSLHLSGQRPARPPRRPRPAMQHGPKADSSLTR